MDRQKCAAGHAAMAPALAQITVSASTVAPSSKAAPTAAHRRRVDHPPAQDHRAVRQPVADHLARRQTAGHGAEIGPGAGAGIAEQAPRGALGRHQIGEPAAARPRLNQSPPRVA